jgi:hypothetical protein
MMDSSVGAQNKAHDSHCTRHSVENAANPRRSLFVHAYGHEVTGLKTYRGPKRKVKAQFEIIPKGTASTGKIFEAYVKNHAIDLLVMGAYRHSRLREFFLPGATYTVVGQPPCWVLMSH